MVDQSARKGGCEGRMPGPCLLRNAPRHRRGKGANRRTEKSGWPEESHFRNFSPALVRLAARAAAREGYEAASEDLLALAGISIEGRKIHRLVNQLGSAVAAALEEGQNQDPKTIPIMNIAIDATGVPMVAEELLGRAGKQEDGSSKTHEVKLGCVF